MTSWNTHEVTWDRHCLFRPLDLFSRDNTGHCCIITQAHHCLLNAAMLSQRNLSVLFGSSPIHKSSSCRPSMQPERLLFSTNDHCLPIITLWLVERAEEYVRPLGKTPGIAYEAMGEELFVQCGLRQFSATLAGSEEFYRIIPRTMFASANNLQKYWCQQWLLKMRWPDSSYKTRFPQWLE